MKSYDLNYSIDACDLQDILHAGSNITITKVDNCTLQISSTGGAGGGNGLKYHLVSGESVTVAQRDQYNLFYNLILDNNSNFTINNTAQLVVKDGTITNNGILTNNGQIFNL